jgi:hypothetical protein
MNKFAEGKTKDLYELLYYSFLLLVERSAESIAKRKKKRNADNDGGAAEDYSDDDNQGGRRRRRRNNRANNAGVERDDDDDSTAATDDDDSCKLDLFMETAIDKTDPSKAAEYRFFLVSYTPQVNFGKIWADIVEECIVNAHDAVKGRKKRNAPEPKAYEKWRRITSRKVLANLMDFRMKKRYATDKLNIVEQRRIEDPDNPICATRFFNLTHIFTSDASPNTHYDQSCYNAGSYYKLDYGQLGKLTFPKRKYVYRISLSDMSVHELHARLMPDYQQLSNNQVLKLANVIMNDSTITKDGSDVDADELFAEVDPRIPEAERGEDAETRADIGNQLAAQWGMGDVDYKTLKNYDKNQAQMQATERLVNIMMLTPGVSYGYGSCYSPLALQSGRNLTKIRNDFNNKDKNARWSQLKNPMLVARKLYLFNQTRMFQLYSSTCRSVDANLSPTGRKIIEYVLKENLYSFNGKVDHRKYDARYSSYVNMEIGLYNAWENVYLVNHMHKYMNLTFKNSLDAYCMNFNRCHQNMLTQSHQGGDGKSYNWTVLSDYLTIPDTTEMLTYETLRSRATDQTNMNDNIAIFDEVEKSLIDQNEKGNDKERAFKLLLTRNKVVAKILQIDDDGNRRTKVTYSECITVFFGSTNSDLNCISSAMARRWHIAHFDERLGINRAIIDLQLSSMILSDGEKTARTLRNKEHHLIQALVFELEKLIYIKAISDVSMHVPTVVLLFISNELAKAGFPQPNPSMFERIMVTARINCILDALEVTFFSPGGKYYGKPISVDCLKDLDKKLFCASQHIVSAIGECYELLIDPAEDFVRRAILQLWGNSKNKVKNLFDGCNQNVAVVKDGMPSATTTWSWITDYNYCKVNFQGATIAHLVAKIWSTIPKLTNPAPSTKYSKDAIKKIIDSWCNRQIQAPKYGQDAKDEAKPIVVDTAETCQELAKQSNKSLFIHTHFLQRKTFKPEEFVENIIKDIYSRRHQLAQSFIWTVDEKNPNIRNMLTVTGAKQREMIDSTGRKFYGTPMITLPSAVRMSAMERSMLSYIGKYDESIRMVEDYKIDTDLDTWGLHQRYSNLFIDKMMIDPECMTKNPLEEIYEKDMPPASAIAQRPFEQSEEVSDDECTPRHRGRRPPRTTLAYQIDHADEQPANAGAPQTADPTDDYDEEIGYFMGVPITELFVDDTKSLASLPESMVIKLYESLDHYDPDKIKADLDFDPEEFFVKEENGVRVYHWDVLAKEAYDNGRKNSSFVMVPPEEERRLGKQEYEKRKQQVFKENMLKYKMVCYHPMMVHHFQNRTFYDHEDKSKTFKYPDDMRRTAAATRQDRWNRASNKIQTDEDIRIAYDELLKQFPGEKSPEFGFMTWQKDKNGKMYRDPNNTMVILENSLGDTLSNMYNNEPAEIPSRPSSYTPVAHDESAQTPEAFEAHKKRRRGKEEASDAEPEPRRKRWIFASEFQRDTMDLDDEAPTTWTSSSQFLNDKFDD